MKIQNLPISALKPYHNNPRNNQKAIDKVADSIARFGFRQPIVVDTENTIIVGHTRFLAAKKLGLTEVPVHVVENLNQAQMKAYRLADNRTAEESSWDIPMLKYEFEELKNFPDLDLSITSFDNAEIAEVLSFDIAVDDSDHVPDNFLEPPITAKGDIWQLGRHRLMCGDTTKWQDVLQLLGNKKVDLIFTDPPYNVGYTGGIDCEREAMENDKMGDEFFFFWLVKNICGLDQGPEVCQAYDIAIFEGFQPS